MKFGLGLVGLVIVIGLGLRSGFGLGSGLYVRVINARVSMIHRVR